MMSRVVHRTALVLLAPRVHDALWDLRARHIRNLGRKMPSHVTMIFPFRNPVDDEALHRIELLCATLPAFTATFAEVGRFRSSVVWLRPEPEEAFARVADAVEAAFPDCAPYGSKHTARTLHLSVGSRLTRDVADALAVEVVALLPLTDRIEALSLMVETGDGWRHDRSWPLVGAPWPFDRSSGATGGAPTS